MIRVRTRVHDKFSLEFKMWFENSIVPEKGKETAFRVESWIFLPASLDVNALTYSREQFYSNIKTYYRTITPVYLLEDLTDPTKKGTPAEFLCNAVSNLINYPSKVNIADYEYQIKMFCAIFKSAIRERYNLLKKELEQARSTGEKEAVGGLITVFCSEVYAVLEYGKGLSEQLKERAEETLYNQFAMGEEFVINLAEFYFYKIYEFSENVAETLQQIEGYKANRGYRGLKRGAGSENSNLLYRWGVLKKYVECDLFLSVDKRKSGVLAEQVYYSIAAGLSMVFATVVSFSFQQKYGNFTMPFFVALVISYMLKDRIKELIRYAFSSNRKLKYFDNKTKLSVKNTVIAESKEGFDIVPQEKIPAVILETRDRSSIVETENSIHQERVLFYRTLITVQGEKLKATSDYRIDGINEIIIFNLSDFVKKMDNPQIPYFLVEEEGISQILVDKVYYINFLFQFSGASGTYIKRYRIMMNRSGILNMEEFE